LREKARKHWAKRGKRKKEKKSIDAVAGLGVYLNTSEATTAEETKPERDQTMNAEVEMLIAEVKKLTARNAEISNAGGFFTAEQIANEKIAWKMKMKLRFDYGMEIGTY